MILGIYCTGGLGREVYELALDISDKDPKWSEIHFISDVEVSGEKLRTDVMSFSEFAKKYSADSAEIAIAIGEPVHRKALREKVKAAGYKLALMVHPSARVSRFAKLEEGVIVCYGCNISCDTHIGANSFFQSSASAGHDTEIGSDCVISACSRVAGNVTIGNCTYIGMSSLVREQITIGNYVIAAMGSVIQKSVEDDLVVMGNPARAYQKNTEHLVFNSNSKNSKK